MLVALGFIREPLPRSTAHSAARQARRHCYGLSVLVFLGALANLPAVAEDVVQVAETASAQGYAEWRGRVVDYTGRELRLQLPIGVERSFPADRVVRIQTQHVPQQVDADQRLARGEFEAALALYREARNSEPRQWVRRQITAQIVRCCQALGQDEWAGKEFLDVLLAGDPDTPYFGCIPLQWLPSQPPLPLERAAREWLDRQQTPAAVLLGASHLMSTNLRGKALEKLSGLAASDDQRVRFLAAAQTWRAAVATALPEQLQAWDSTIERMPEPLRAGPYFVLGSAEAQHQRWEQAALAWLRVPLLYPEHRPLAARSLAEAGRCLERLGRPEQAIALYREVVERFPNTASHAEAEARLKEMESGG